jgi:hypothetical protein
VAITHHHFSSNLLACLLFSCEEDENSDLQFSQGNKEMVPLDPTFRVSILVALEEQSIASQTISLLRSDCTILLLMGTTSLFPMS